MTAEYSGPPFEALRTELTALVTHGLTPANVVAHGGQLMNLQVVLGRVEADEEVDDEVWEVAVAEALIDVLRELATSPRKQPKTIYVFRSKHRKLLRAVLPLDPKLAGKPLKRRRGAAAKAIDVEESTARTYHEPRALDDLTRALIAFEAEHRGQDPPPSPT